MRYLSAIVSSLVFCLISTAAAQELEEYYSDDQADSFNSQEYNEMEAEAAGCRNGDVFYRLHRDGDNKNQVYCAKYICEFIPDLKVTAFIPYRVGLEDCWAAIVSQFARTKALR